MDTIFMNSKSEKAFIHMSHYLILSVNLQRREKSVGLSNLNI